MPGISQNPEQGKPSENPVKVVKDYLQRVVDVRNKPLSQMAAEENESLIDPLTGLYNRRGLKQKLQEFFDRSNRSGEQFTLIMADLDNFKVCNDTFGHPAGDDLLRQIAEIFKTGIRATDVVARYGGEEFTLLLSFTDHFGALKLAEKLRAAIKEKTGQTISMGAADYRNSNHQEIKDSNTLVAAADKCLYLAKQQGRNKVVSINGPALQENNPLK